MPVSSLLSIPARHSKAMGALGLALAFGIPAQGATRDTVLVTRIESQDTAGRVLKLVSQAWELTAADRLRQRQYEGPVATGRLSAEQVFDGSGRALRVDVFDTSGQVLRRSDLAYDDKGRLIRIVLHDATAPAAYRKQIITYTLRPDGEPSEVRSTDSLDQVLSLLIYRYDGAARLREMEEQRGGTIYLLVKHQWTQDGLQDTLLTLASGKDSAEVRLKVYAANRKILRERVSLRLSNGSWFTRETHSTYDGEDRLVREDNYDGLGQAVGRNVYTWETVTLTVPVTSTRPGLRSAREEGRVSLHPRGRDALGRGEVSKRVRRAPGAGPGKPGFQKPGSFLQP